MTLFDRFSAVIAAWNARDIDAALVGMDDAIVWHFATGALAPLRGKGAVRSFLETLHADTIEAHWSILYHAEKDDRLFVEGVDAYTRRNGISVAMPYAAVIEFKDGGILAWRDYIDTRRMEKQRDGAPMPGHLGALIHGVI